MGNNHPSSSGLSFSLRRFQLESRSCSEQHEEAGRWRGRKEEEEAGEGRKRREKGEEEEEEKKKGDHVRDYVFTMLCISFHSI